MPLADSKTYDLLIDLLADLIVGDLKSDEEEKGIRIAPDRGASQIPSYAADAAFSARCGLSAAAKTLESVPKRSTTSSGRRN
jgi:hypothetical protein